MYADLKNAFIDGAQSTKFKEQLAVFVKEVGKAF